MLKKVWESGNYFGALVVPADSKIKSITDLKDKRVGFVDEKSASGRIYPLAMLKKRKINTDKFFKEIKFFGQHENVMKALVKGDIDVAAVYANDAKAKTGAWTRFTPEAKVKVLWVSQAIPNDPFCVRNEFYEKYPKLTHDLMFTLIDYRDQPNEKNLLKRLSIDSVDLATSRQYDSVRETVGLVNP